MHALKRLLFSFTAGLSLCLAPALHAQTAEYIFIDLSDGSISTMNATYGALAATAQESKTKSLALRRVAAGSTAGIEIKKDYYLGVYELTRAQRNWLREPPEEMTATLPYIGILSEVEIEEIMTALQTKTSASLSGTFRLPTTNEWSFAAHGREFTKDYTISIGEVDTLPSGAAWFGLEYEVDPYPVGTSAAYANTLGLYDMHGNASELATVGNVLYMMGGDWTMNATNCTAHSEMHFKNASTFLQGHATIRVCYIPPSATANELTVDGVSQGFFEPGETVTIAASTTQVNVSFSHWAWSPEVSLGDSFDASAQTTIVTMPAQAVALTSVWAQFYTLTVDGVEQGSYPAGRSIGVTAVPPTPGLTFSSWGWSPTTPGPGPDFNDSLASTTVTMPAMNLALTSSWMFSGDFLSVKIDYFATGMTTEELTQVAYPLAAKYKDTHVLLRRFKAGTYTIGSPDSEPGRSDDYELQHAVILKSDRYVGVTEITRAQWNRLMNPGTTPTDGSLPMLASYSDIRGSSSSTSAPSNNSFMGLFLERFNAFTARVDLPTDAEWEVACRAGTTGSWNNGTTITPETLVSDPNLDRLGIYAAGALSPVATKLPNSAGLYDMHGNAAEWCRDQFAAYSAATVIDPITVWGDYFVLRGGSYAAEAAACRSAARAATKQSSSATAGFRLQLTLPAQHRVIVENGTGTGIYAEGSSVTISAGAAPAGSSFSAWVVTPADTDLGSSFKATDATTTLTVPPGGVVITATYAAGLLLDVRGGTGGGYFEKGSVNTIRAAAQGPDTLVFDKWIVTPAGTNLGEGFVATEAATLVTMPEQGVVVTASWKDSRGVLVPVSVVKGTTASATATPDTWVEASANTAAFGYEFDRWVATPASISLDSAYTATTFFKVPASFTAASNITLTATYKLKGDYAIFSVSSNITPRPLAFSNQLPVDSKKVHLVLRRIEPGTFMMGTSPTDKSPLTAERLWSSAQFDSDLHEVAIEQPFYIGVYELTQAQWGYLSSGATTSDLPQAGVTYNAATKTIAPALVSKTGLSGFTIPTPEQWEYACRAGNSNAYYNATALVTNVVARSLADSIAWTTDNATAAKSVGGKAPNAWGLYDMSGNLQEWTLAPNATAVVYANGGSYTNDYRYARSAARLTYGTTPSSGRDSAGAKDGVRVLYNPPAVYTLAVEGGRGSASVIEPGQTTMIAAVTPEGKRFVRWEGAPLSALSSASDANAIVTMPEENAAYAAVFEDAPIYKVVVIGGVGNVSLPGPGIATGIIAALPSAGQVFSGWTVAPAGTSLGADFNAASPNTSVILSSAGTVTLTATYQTKRPGARLMIR